MADSPRQTPGARIARKLAKRTQRSVRLHTAAVEARAVTPRGAHVVSLAETVGPFFLTMPEEMFSLDRFHPSSLGYKRTAQALLPAVLSALEELDAHSSRRTG